VNNYECEKCKDEVQFYKNCLRNGFLKTMFHISAIACTKQLAEYRVNKNDKYWKIFSNCTDKILKETADYVNGKEKKWWKSF
jgi:hypothetical protein